MANQGVIKQEGEVIENLSNSNFRVRLDVGPEIFCTISGKMRQRNIRLIVGDRVRVELSLFDLTRGRISYRLNEKKNN